MQALHKQMRKCAIPSRHEFLVTKLLTGNEERIAGVIGVDFQTGGIIHIAAKTVILATGGGELYLVNSNMPDATGNGAVLAVDAGADLVDMEFILMLGHAVLHPQTVRDVLFTFQYLLPKGAQLPFHSLNEAFLAKYDPDGSDNPPRHIYYARTIHGNDAPEQGIEGSRRGNALGRDNTVRVQNLICAG